MLEYIIHIYVRPELHTQRGKTFKVENIILKLAINSFGGNRSRNSLRGAEFHIQISGKLRILDINIYERRSILRNAENINANLLFSEAFRVTRH
jgi:hypothetical protein